MKKISTLGFGIFISLASFANFAPTRLTVSAESNTNLKVLVDGNRDQQVGNRIVFENLQPGYHSIEVYQFSDKQFGFFRHNRSGYKLLYTTSVNIKPLFATSIELNRFGNAHINEWPMRKNYKEEDWKGSDHRYDINSREDQHDADKSNGNDGSNYYNHTISNQDFFAAERVMDRENDRGRLIYAKRVMDDNYLRAEQVKELARFFSFDDCRLEFVKYAYGKTTDRNNFSVVCNAFVSNDGRNQVMNFLRNCR